MAVIEIFKLFGTIFIDNDPANRKLDETDAKAGKVGNTLAKTAKTAAKWGAAIAAGAAAAGGALFALVNRVTDTAAAIDAKRKQLGVTSEALQEYSYAADQVGVAQDSMERALGRLNQRIGLAERGNEKYRKSLDELGVTSRDTSEAFVQAIEALHQMDDANLRSAAAADLFGTQLARQLMPIIEEGGEGLLALRNRAHELGKVMDQDATIASNNFQSALADIRGIVTGIAQDIVMKVLPRFEHWAVWTADNIPKVWAVFQFLGEVVEIVFRYMGLIVGDSIQWLRDNAIGPFVTWLTAVWQERGPSIIAAVEALWEGVKAVFSQVFANLQALWEVFVLAFEGDWEAAWERLKTAFTDAWNALPELFTGIINPLIDIADNIMTAVIDVIRSVFGDDVGDIFQTAWDAIVVVFEAARDVVLGIWEALTAAFQGDWSAAWDAIQGVVQTAWSAIETVVESGLEIINTIIDGALNGIVALVRWAFGDEAADAVDGGLEVIRTIVDTVTQAILGIVRTFTALFQGDWLTAWEEVKSVANTIWNALPDIFEQAINLLIGIADTVMTAVIGVIRRLFGDNVADHFQGIWDAVRLIFETALDVLLSVWSAFTALFQGDWRKAWGDLVSAFALIWDNVPIIISEVLNNVFGIVDTVMQGLIALIRQGFGDPVADVFQTAWDVVMIVFETARDTLLGILSLFTSLFRGDWEQAWSDVVAIFSGIWDGIVSIFTGPLNAITDFFSYWTGRFIDSFVNLKDRVIESVQGLAEGVIEWFSESKLGGTFKWLNDQINGVIGWFFEMYDKVVGHSYVPDMVEEIGEAIQRLKDRLANPVARYTSEVIASFEDMEEEVVASMLSMAERLDDVLKTIVDRITQSIGDITRAFWAGTATWNNILHTFAGGMGSIFGAMFDAIAKELVSNLILQNEWIVSTLANIATTITAYLSQAFAALTAFYWFLGPGAPVAAGATIAAAIAAIASIGGRFVRGLLPDAPNSTMPGAAGSGGGGRSGGRQVSEITGPTRDLLIDLLTPLASLNSLTGIGERIYTLLDDRLPGPVGATLAVAGGSYGAPQVRIDQLNVYPQTSSTQSITDDTVEEIERKLAERLARSQRRRGG